MSDLVTFGVASHSMARGKEFSGRAARPREMVVRMEALEGIPRMRVASPPPWRSPQPPVPMGLTAG
ncbi:hypothetical protein JT06_17750 [Desulfobulbus sp. Tol-SR]|nr:hypothetical protein JT06_17750 [Desulfobulbus sp. Tol-SR]